MKLKFDKFFIVVCLFAALISCEKETRNIVSKSPSSFSEIFDEFWEKMNTNYVYWDVDTTNWDAIRSKYSPLFSQLNLHNLDDKRKSVSYFRQMTKTLLDNHYFITFTADGISDSTIYSSFERKQYELDFHYPYSYSKVDTAYLDSGFIINVDNNNSVNGVPLIVVSGVINNNLLYFSCNHFALYKSYQSKTANSIRPAMQMLFINLKDTSYKGVIIDVRSNQGGDISDLNFLLGQLIDTPLLFGFTQVKSNNGRFEYTPWIDAFVKPQGEKKRTSRPIVVLADMVSASLAETVVMAIRAMPHSLFIGEQTWGATGPVTSEDVFNDGQFSISGFMNVQTSSCKFKYIDNKIYEFVGFPPDIPLTTDAAALTNGKDPQLEKAIRQF